MDSKDLWVELKPDRPSRMVLKGTYGKHVHETFRMSRQGLRWRFEHLFNLSYVAAFETILFIEKDFGPDLREYAIRISRERYNMWQEVLHRGFQSADRLRPRDGTTKEHPDRVDSLAPEQR